MKFFNIAIVSLLALAATTGCTENVRSRQFGGTSTVNLKCDQKLFTVTWKDVNLWYATRPMRKDEQPEEYSFHESSSLGVLEGTVILKESHCKPIG